MHKLWLSLCLASMLGGSRALLLALPPSLPLPLPRLRSLAMSAARSLACNPRHQVVVLAGATSVGKSAVSLELCKFFDAEIVVADSVQVYKGLDIGSNKPTAEEQAVVPHHLLDVSEPSQQMNTADFSERAAAVIRDIVRRNKLPIVVGGSTMWIQWLVHGKPDAPKCSAAAAARVREILDDLERDRLWEQGVSALRTHDAVRADKVMRNDWYRLRRYLEIAVDLSLGNDAHCSSDDEDATHGGDKRTSLTGSRTQYLDGLDVRCFFLMEARESLYRTIDERCELMLHAGLFEEVFQLLQNEQLRPEYPIAKSIGYRQVIDYFSRNELGDEDRAFEDFLRDFGTATRNYAKRQCNWHRRDNKFLFLKMQRSAERRSLVHGSPYEQVAREIQHWLQGSEEDFASELQTQCTIAQCFNQHLSKGRFNISTPLTDANEFCVLEWLIRHKAIKLSGGAHGVGQDELFTQWLQQHQAFAKASVPSPWTATELDTRAGEIGDKLDSMKRFRSRLLTGDQSRFAALHEKAVRMKDELWRDHFDLMQGFKST